MKRVCGWCTREMDDADQPGILQVTHGLCPECRRRVFPSEKAKEVDLLSAIPNEINALTAELTSEATPIIHSVKDFRGERFGSAAVRIRQAGGTRVQELVLEDTTEGSPTS
jgi:hypothetical protein